LLKNPDPADLGGDPESSSVCKDIVVAWADAESDCGGDPIFEFVMTLPPSVPSRGENPGPIDVVGEIEVGDMGDELDSVGELDDCDFLLDLPRIVLVEIRFIFIICKVLSRPTAPIHRSCSGTRSPKNCWILSIFFLRLNLAPGESSPVKSADSSEAILFLLGWTAPEVSFTSCVFSFTERSQVSVREVKTESEEATLNGRGLEQRYSPLVEVRRLSLLE